jgi:hypothetical protein
VLPEQELGFEHVGDDWIGCPQLLPPVGEHARLLGVEIIRVAFG